MFYILILKKLFLFNLYYFYKKFACGFALSACSACSTFFLIFNFSKFPIVLFETFAYLSNFAAALSRISSNLFAPLASKSDALAPAFNIPPTTGKSPPKPASPFVKTPATPDAFRNPSVTPPLC